MDTFRRPARRTADELLRSQAAARVAVRIGGRRDRRIVLLWHRIRPHGPSPWEIVRTVPTDLFRAQLDVVQALGDVVSLADIESRPPGSAPAFALTFDDDDPGHAEHTLPELLRRSVPATFFLSGRWRAGLGPYWWQVIEERIRSSGCDAVAASFGLPPGLDAQEIGRRLTGTPHAAAAAVEGGQRGEPAMEADHAAALTAAGMEIGYHTRDHHPLPTQSDEDAADAAADGRRDLAQALGTTIDRFAYPHGQADARVADRVRAAGYRSGWTTARRTVSDDDDPMLRGRWSLEELEPRELRAVLLRAMVRPGP